MSGERTVRTRGGSTIVVSEIIAVTLMNSVQMGPPTYVRIELRGGAHVDSVHGWGVEADAAAAAETEALAAKMIG